jgi:hypothetical protein
MHRRQSTFERLVTEIFSEWGYVIPEHNPHDRLMDRASSIDFCASICSF